MIHEHEWQQWQQQSAGHAATAAFLLLDVQTNLTMLETLQAALDKIKGNPDVEPYVISGNSYFILLQPQQVLIEELYGDDTPNLSPSVWMILVMPWGIGVSNRHKKRPPIRKPAGVTTAVEAQNLASLQPLNCLNVTHHSG